MTPFCYSTTEGYFRQTLTGHPGFTTLPIAGHGLFTDMYGHSV